MNHETLKVLLHNPELHKAIVEGKMIQYYGENKWEDCDPNNFYLFECTSYRVKPIPKTIELNIVLNEDQIFALYAVLNITEHDFKERVKESFFSRENLEFLSHKVPMQNSYKELWCPLVEDSGLFSFVENERVMNSDLYRRWSQV